MVLLLSLRFAWLPPDFPTLFTQQLPPPRQGDEPVEIVCGEWLSELRFKLAAYGINAMLAVQQRQQKMLLLADLEVRSSSWILHDVAAVFSQRPNHQVGAADGKLSHDR